MIILIKSKYIFNILYMSPGLKTQRNAMACDDVMFGTNGTCTRERELALRL